MTKSFNFGTVPPQNRPPNWGAPGSRYIATFSLQKDIRVRQLLPYPGTLVFPAGRYEVRIPGDGGHLVQWRYVTDGTLSYGLFGGRWQPGGHLVAMPPAAQRLAEVQAQRIQHAIATDSHRRLCKLLLQVSGE